MKNYIAKDSFGKCWYISAFNSIEALNEARRHLIDVKSLLLNN